MEPPAEILAEVVLVEESGLRFREVEALGEERAVRLHGGWRCGRVDQSLTATA
jgi:hypothetical protein